MSANKQHKNQLIDPLSQIGFPSGSVITRTIFHLQARDRCGTDDQAETGPKSEPALRRNQHRNHVHTDSMSFNKFHLSMNFISTVLTYLIGNDHLQTTKIGKHAR